MIEKTLLCLHLDMSMDKLLAATPIATAIMDLISASDVSSLLYACGTGLSDYWKRYYMNPIRDLPEYQSWIENETKNRNWVVLVGKDLNALKDRIANPASYWSSAQARDGIHIWLASRNEPPHLCGDEIATENKIVGGSTPDMKCWRKSVIKNENNITLYFVPSDPIKSGHPPPYRNAIQCSLWPQDEIVYNVTGITVNKTYIPPIVTFKDRIENMDVISMSVMFLNESELVIETVYADADFESSAHPDGGMWSRNVPCRHSYEHTGEVLVSVMIVVPSRGVYMHKHRMTVTCPKRLKSEIAF